MLKCDTTLSALIKHYALLESTIQRKLLELVIDKEELEDEHNEFYISSFSYYGDNELVVVYGEHNSGYSTSTSLTIEDVMNE